jgi:hypothetical protein
MDNRQMDFLKYWKENFKAANGWLSFVNFIISGVAWLIFALCKMADLRSPSENIFASISWIAGVLFFGLGFLFLPFRRHEADKKIHQAEITRHESNFAEAKRQIETLQKKIEDDAFKLEINSTLAIQNNKNRLTGMLTIQVVNNGRRPAKIRRAIMVGLPTTITTLENTILESSECEYTAHQEKVVVEISGDGGLHIWRIEILNHPHYKFVVRNGERYALGFLEFTNGNKQEFETLLPPEAEMQRFGRWMNPPYH